MLSNQFYQIDLQQPEPIRQRVRRRTVVSRAVALAGTFGLLLMLPLLDQAFNLSAGFRSTEKRQLSPMPTLHFLHVMTYIQQFNQYYKENFGWRNALFYQYSRWKYTVLHTSPLPDKVLIGRNGWFYPGNSLAQVQNQHRGLAPIAPSTLNAIADRLGHYQQQLARRGTRLYLLIAPDSYAIYPENLPDNFRVSAQPSNYDRLKQHLARHTSIPLIDVRANLRLAKPQHLVYYQTDTHWNNYGSLTACLALANRLRQDFPQIPAVRLDDYRVRTMPGAGGDLVTMLALNHDVTDSVDYRISPAAHLATRQIADTPNPEMNLPTQRFVSNNSQSPRLFLVGDSFSYSMNQFLPGYFRESYITRSNRLDTKSVYQEQPDIVVIEIVERNIARLAEL